MSTSTEQLLRERLNALAPEECVIIDESHRHAGHQQANGGAHFNVHLVSKQFVGLSRVQRHQRVYQLVNDLMPKPIHALALITRTPEEV